MDLLLIGIALFVVLVPVIVLALVYNSFISLKQRMDNSLSQIDVQTKRRYDLIPNLVETVKGYAKHERGVFTEVTQARAAISKAGTLAEKARAENMLSSTLKSLFAVAEAYPDLKANQNFMMLQEELSGIESKIAYARQFYNDSVMSWNQKVQMFPSNLVAGMFGFKAREYFEAPESREAVKVNF